MPEKIPKPAILSPAAGAAQGISSLKSSHKIIAWLAGAVLLVALGVVVSFLTYSQIEEAAAVRKHTNAVLDGAGELLSALRDAETGQRGYLLTGDKAFLEPYLAVRDRISGQLVELRRITLVSAAQKHLDALAPLVDAKLAHMSHAIELRRNHDVTAALASVRGGQGRQLMDAIRAEMGGVIQIEQGVLAQREAEFQSSMRQLFTIIVATTLLTLMFVFAFAWLIYRESQQRIKNLVHLETQRLLDNQRDTNKQLQQTNAALQGSKDALRKAAPLQNAIFNSANFSSIATDAKGVIQIFNVGAEHMLGYAAADVMNKITPADISDPQEVIARAKALSVELGTPITPGFEALVFKASRGIEDIYELTYIRKDGSRFPAVVSVTALRDAEDTIIGYLLIGTDNTARKQAEEALLKAGALQTAIFNSANFSSIATDAKGVIQIFNVGAERMLGYAAADVMNKITPADISDPQEVIARAKALSAELGTPITPGFEALVFKAARGIEDIYELTYIRKDGSRFPAVVSVTALRDAEDAIIGYLLIGTDNTARKQVEAEKQRLLEIQEETHKQLQRTNATLQVSEEKLTVTLNSIGDAVIATDAEARVTFLNPIAEQLTGWTQAQASGHPVDEIFHIINQETRQPATIPVMETLAHGTVQGLANHTVLIARDGSECAIADSCAPIRDRDGQVIGAVLVFRDVTEEYAAQQALSEQQAELELQNEELRTSQEALHVSQERYFDLYDFAPVGYCTVSEQGLILEANLTIATLLGLPRSALVKQPISRFIFKEDTDIYYLLHKQLSKTGEPQKCELRMVNDGTQVWVQLSVTAAQDNGAPVLRIVMNNINERKRAEEALFKAGALQRAIFNSANFSSIATDAKGVIQIFNVGAERMLGYTAADVMNKITPADISDPQEVIARAKALSIELSAPITPGFEALVFKASRGIEDIYELTYIRKDGSRFPAVVSVTALRDAQDTIIGYLLIGTDNTARKQAEEALLKAGALQKAIFDSANFSSIATDAKGVIQIFNVGAEHMLGYAAADVMNKITPADISDPQEVIARAKALSAELGTTITPGFEALVFKASRGIEDIYELTYIRKDGSRFPAVVSVTALRDAEDTIIGYLLIGTDNTARKLVEAERALLYETLQDKNVELESARFVAEKANLAKSVFLSRMSHELRTPLNAILGFAQLLEGGSPAPTAAQIVRLHQIIKAGWYLLELINEILDLALIESGKLSLSREPVSLIDVMRECQAMIEPQAQKHDIHISFLPFDNTWFAHADRTRVKQVMINLLSNAIKYNREHGTVEVKCTGTPERIRISIRDSGMGLPPEKLLQLFQPFNRLGQESGTEEGTGIGLVVTKQLVELMGGTVGVKSTVGVGSEFWIELIRDVTPLQPATGNIIPAELVPQAHGDAARYTLLYVEDNPANLLLVEQIIQDHPHVSMLSARNGNLGVALARTHLPDVILMDINLPGISGVEAMNILRQDPAMAHIPVIALSANAMPRDIEEGLEAGFFRYLTKPIKVNEFMNALDEALRFAETGKLPEKELVNTNETGQKS